MKRYVKMTKEELIILLRKTPNQTLKARLLKIIAMKRAGILK
jgi:hypothetical protein